MTRSPQWGDTTAVYVVQMGNTVKIGITRNPWQRIPTLQTGCPEPLKLRALTVLSSRQKAARSEELIHKRLAGRRMMGEWFRVDWQDAVEITNRTIDNVLYGCRKRPPVLRFDDLDEALAWAERVNGEPA